MVDENGDFIEKSQKAFSKNVLAKRTANKKLNNNIKRLKESNSLNEEKSIAFGDSIFKQAPQPVTASCSKHQTSNIPNKSVLETDNSSAILNKQDSSTTVTKQLDTEMHQNNYDDSDLNVDDNDCGEKEENKYLYFIPDGNYLI